MSNVTDVVAHLEMLIGKSIFEIPTPPVSVPGIRLHDTMSMGLDKNQGLQSFPDMVQRVTLNSRNVFQLMVARKEGGYTIQSKRVVLATGRFMGKGLIAERTGIREALLDLPVSQPERREHWHQNDLFHPDGHPLNLAGIETDHQLRPLTASGNPYADQLYAAGAILAHSDWTRMKCGSGVAVATALAAVKAMADI